MSTLLSLPISESVNGCPLTRTLARQNERERVTCRGFQMYYESPRGDEELLRGQHERDGKTRLVNTVRRPLLHRQVNERRKDEDQSLHAQISSPPWPEHWKDTPRGIDQVFHKLNVQLFDGKLSSVSIQWARTMTR